MTPSEFISLSEKWSGKVECEIKELIGLTHIYLQSLSVKRRDRNKGYGSEFMKDLQLHVSSIELVINPHNSAYGRKLRHFYTKLGFYQIEDPEGMERYRWERGCETCTDATVLVIPGQECLCTLCNDLCSRWRPRKGDEDQKIKNEIKFIRSLKN